MFAIKEMRNRAGLKQNEAAAALGMPVRTYGGYEREEREINLAVAIRLADLFGCTLDELAGRDWPTVQTIVDPVDQKLLDLYHSTDARGRAIIMRNAVAESGMEGQSAGGMTA